MKKNFWIAASFLFLSTMPQTMEEKDKNTKTPQEDIMDCLIKASQKGDMDLNQIINTLANKYPQEFDFILGIKENFSRFKPQIIKKDPKQDILDSLISANQEGYLEAAVESLKNSYPQEWGFIQEIQANFSVDQPKPVQYAYIPYNHYNNNNNQQERNFVHYNMFQSFQQIAYKNTESMTQLKGIVNHFNNIPQGTDVHQLDQFCLTNCAQLLKISELFKPALHQEKAQQIWSMNLQNLLKEMWIFINDNPKYFEKFSYENQEISLNGLHQLLTQQVTRAIHEGFLTYGSQQGTALWSHTFALIVELHHDRYLKEEDKHRFVVEFFRSFVEGLKTNGGCVQGFFDRGMARLAFQLAGFRIIKN